jgi:hypothetical protein
MSFTENASAGGASLPDRMKIDHVMTACNCSEGQAIRLLQVSLSDPEMLPSSNFYRTPTMTRNKQKSVIGC